MSIKTTIRRNTRSHDAFTSYILEALEDTGVITLKDRFNPRADKLLDRLPELCRDILHATSSASRDLPLKERIYLIAEGRTREPTCRCGATLRFNHRKNAWGKYCSRRCGNKYAKRWLS